MQRAQLLYIILMYVSHSEISMHACIYVHTLCRHVHTLCRHVHTLRIYMQTCAYIIQTCNVDTGHSTQQLAIAYVHMIPLKGNVTLASHLHTS